MRAPSIQFGSPVVRITSHHSQLLQCGFWRSNPNPQICTANDKPAEPSPPVLQRLVLSLVPIVIWPLHQPCPHTVDIAQVLGVKLGKESVQRLIMAIPLFKSICLKQWEMPASHCEDISYLLFSQTIDTHRITKTRLILRRATLRCLRPFEHRWPLVMYSSSLNP